MLIVNAHLFVRKQEVIEGLVHTYPNVKANLLQVVLGYIHVRLGDAGAQIALSAAGKSLAEAEHVLGLVQIPRLTERNSPTAIHSHGIVERAGEWARVPEQRQPDGQRL